MKNLIPTLTIILSLVSFALYPKSEEGSDNANSDTGTEQQESKEKQTGEKEEKKDR